VADVRGIAYQEKKERITRLIESLDLEGKQGETITGYSQGMKQKVAIMGAILHHPKILLMDEPLNGLDPKSARVVKELIHSLARDGVTTIFSTHVLEIAEAICDRLTILQNGRVLAEALQKSCEKRQVSPIPGLKMSSSNSRERKALKILLRLSGDENSCPAQVCQNLDALTPLQYQTKFSLE